MLSNADLQTAVFALAQISDTTPGERSRRASVVALVLRAIVAEMTMDAPESGFLRRRAEIEVDRLESATERKYLRRVLGIIEQGGKGVGEILGEYAAALEEARRLAEADAVISLARSGEPQRADLALRAARVARLMGDRDRALELYEVARELDGGSGSVARLAAIGRAVANESRTALSVAVRTALRAGDAEAGAVGLEERGRMRRAAGDRLGAARDLGAAAARFPDPVDRARVAHQLADLFIAADDPAAAREALHFALSSGDRSQQAHARVRLHTVSRDLGDQVGMRRWRSFERPALVSLSSRLIAGAHASAAHGVARWRERVESLLANRPV